MARTKGEALDSKRAPSARRSLAAHQAAEPP